MDWQDIPQDVVDEWAKQCSCCVECSGGVCGGVMAGGLCDNTPCRCLDHDDNYGDTYHDYE